MTDTVSQHLYVMQNEFGCIKVGRSVNPWHRRLSLRQTEHCRVELIAAFEGGGEDEEAIHIALDRFRLEGEWFSGANDARMAIEHIFGADPMEWQFEHDPTGAEKWLDHLRVVRDAAYIRRELSRSMARLRTATEASWVHDGSIFWCRYLAETGNSVMIMTDKQKGNTVNVWHNPATKKREVLPAYTSTVEEALLAWPEDLRPTLWEGTPFECCIAALDAVRTRLPKVTRRTMSLD